MITDPTIITRLLEFAESVANNSSGNLHGFHSHLVHDARQVVKMAGGELKEMGRFRAGECEPMSHKEWDQRKDERKVERVLAALKLGPVRFISDDIYDLNNKRVCTHSELVWIRKRLKENGVRLIQRDQVPNVTWEIYTKEAAEAPVPAEPKPITRHPPLQAGEVFLGNRDSGELPVHLRGISGIRLAQPAYDIEGEYLPEYFALIADQHAAVQYDQIMTERLRKIRGW